MLYAVRTNSVVTLPAFFGHLLYGGGRGNFDFFFSTSGEAWCAVFMSCGVGIGHAARTVPLAALLLPPGMGMLPGNQHQDVSFMTCCIVCLAME